MSLDTSVTLDWADGTYIFRLGVTEIEELEEKCDMGLLRLYRRMGTDDFRFKDMRQIFRLGLIGGGMDPIRALRLVDRYVVPPTLRHHKAAANILAPAIITPDPDLGKSPAGETAKETDSPNGSSPPHYSN